MVKKQNKTKILIRHADGKILSFKIERKLADEFV